MGGWVGGCGVRVGGCVCVCVCVCVCACVCECACVCSLLRVVHTFHSGMLKQHLPTYPSRSTQDCATMKLTGIMPS